MNSFRNRVLLPQIYMRRKLKWREGESDHNRMRSFDSIFGLSEKFSFCFCCCCFLLLISISRTRSDKLEEENWNLLSWRWYYCATVWWHDADGCVFGNVCVAFNEYLLIYHIIIYILYEMILSFSLNFNVIATAANLIIVYFICFVGIQLLLFLLLNAAFRMARPTNADDHITLKCLRTKPWIPHIDIIYYIYI